MSLSGFSIKLVMAAYDHPRWALAGLLLIIGLSLSQFPLVKLDTSIESLLGKQSDTYQDYKSYIDKFGSDSHFLITISADDVLDPDVLSGIKQLHAELEEELPYIQRIISLINAPKVTRDDQRVYIGRALDDWPETAQQWQAKQRQLINYSPYQNVLLDKQRKLTLIIIQPLSRYQKNGKEVRLGTPEYREIADKIKRILPAYQTEAIALNLTGHAAVDAVIQGVFIQDIFVLGSVSFLMGVLILFLLFQRLFAAVLPSMIIGTTAMVVIALMTVFDQPLYITTSLLPSLIVIFGTADAVHLINAFNRRFVVGCEKRDAFKQAIEKTLKPLFVTSITTSAGLFSFTFVEVAALSVMGVFAAIAALLALVFTLYVSAIVIRLANIESVSADRHARQPLQRLSGGIAAGCLSLAIRAPWMVLTGAILLIVLSLTVVSQIRFSHDLISWIPEEWSEVQGVRLLDKHYSASISADVVVDSGQPKGVQEPNFMAWLGDLQQTLDDQVDGETFGRSFSIKDMISQVSLAFEDEVIDYQQAINGDRLLWRDMRLLELGINEDYRAFVSEDQRYARTTLTAKRLDADDYAPFIRDIQKVLNDSEKDSQLLLTGLVVVLSETLDAIAAGAVQSYILAVVCITLMIMIFLRSVGIGLITMLPNLLPIIVMLALMRLWGWDLDVFTLMIASITVGIVVDDTIHFMNHFRNDMQQHGDPVLACRQALDHSGQAMFVTTCVLAVCFSVMHLSPLNNINIFALVSTGIVILGLLADYLLLPALMMLIYRKKRPEKAALNEN